MALVRKCDRCGTFHTGHINKLVTTDHVPFEYNEHEYDLCDECFDEFADFMNGVKPKDLLGRLKAAIK